MDFDSTVNSMISLDALIILPRLSEFDSLKLEENSISFKRPHSVLKVTYAINFLSCVSVAVVDSMMLSQTHPHPNSGEWECVTLEDKRDSADMIKLRILRWCISLDYPDGSSLTTRVLINGRPGGDGNRSRSDNRSRGQGERERGLGGERNSDRGEDRDRQTDTYTGRGRDLKTLSCWLARLRKEPQAKECRMRVTSGSWADGRINSP